MSATIAQLKSLERAAYRFFKMVQKVAETDPSFATQVEPVRDRWIELHNRWEAKCFFLAAKKDKGVELFTVFVPESHSVKEVRRTSHRRLTTHHWKRTYPFPHYDPHGGESAAVIHRFDDTPDQEFARLMKVKVAA